MTRAVAAMAGNHVAANLLMLFLVLGGLYAAGQLKQEVFPDTRPEVVDVVVEYPGATPADVEDAIVLPIELAVAEVDYVRRIRSSARESVGTVSMELIDEGDVDVALEEVRSAVDRIRTFPEEAERPEILRLSRRSEVVSLYVYGDTTERALLEIAEGVRDDLVALPEITMVQLSGHRPYEISIEIPEDDLRRYDLTLPTVAELVREASLDLGGGTIRADGGDVLIRTTEKRYTGADYADVPVFRTPSGETVLLGEIAHVIDGFAPTDQRFVYDGWPAVLVQVYQVGQQKPGEIAAVVERYVDERNRQLPASVRLSIAIDWAEQLGASIALLSRNALAGAILVFILLALFLEIRLALWVTSGIAISFLGALSVMPALGVSINFVSLFGFLIAIGIVVDDAIVIGENIYVQRENGAGSLQAAVDGACGMARPVTFAVLTTVAAFASLLFVGGAMGRLGGDIPIVVGAVLLASLAESLFILPAHLAGSRGRSAARVWETLEAKRRGVDRVVARLIAAPFRRLQLAAQTQRYLTVAVALSLVMLCAGLVGGGFLRFSLFPSIEDDDVEVSLAMNPGASVDETSRAAQRIFDVGLDLMQEYEAGRVDGESDLRHSAILVGGTLEEEEDGDAGSHLAQVSFFLAPSGQRETSAFDFANDWRDRIPDMAGVDRIEFSAETNDVGADIEIELAHPDFRALTAAAEQLKQALASYAGVSQVVDSHTEGKRELKLRLRPEAGALGITETDLAVQVRSAFYGAEALRITRGRNELKVMVRYPDSVRRTLSAIDKVMLRTPDGREIPFREAAFVEEGRSFSEIVRTNRRRVITVSAMVDEDIGNASEILGELTGGELRSLMQRYPGLSYDLEGESREERETVDELVVALSGGLLAIYSLLAVAFRSYTQPLIIMSAIPFGIVGALFGHVPFGLPISLLSLFGIVAMAGVVVNDSLVLIDCTNRLRAAGRNAFDAAAQAAQRRFRPVVITSLTTFCGLMPIALDRSEPAQFLVPLAVSLAFGVLASTAVTLVLVPSLYLIVDDVRLLLGPGRPERAEAEP